MAFLPNFGQELDRAWGDGYNETMERVEFTRLVKEALTHLYDHTYLQRHPLATALLPDAAREVGGLTLHRVLIEAIEALRPPASLPPSAPTWRPYLVLYRRYVRAMDAEAVAQELAISALAGRARASQGPAGIDRSALAPLPGAAERTRGITWPLLAG